MSDETIPTKKPIPKGLKPFPKGVSGNPAGRKPFSEDLKRVKEIDAREFKRRASKYLRMTVSELNVIETDTNTEAIDLIIISIIQKAGRSGDWMRMNFLLDRLIGKVSEKAGDGGGGQKSKLIILPSNGREITAALPPPDEDDHEENE